MTTDITNHKGQKCTVKPMLCQEGYCSDCYLWISCNPHKERNVSEHTEQTVPISDRGRGVDADAPKVPEWEFLRFREDY